MIQLLGLVKTKMVKPFGHNPIWYFFWDLIKPNIKSEV